MAGEFFLVAKDLPGQLWIMPRPNGHGQLKRDIAAYQAAGIERIVSMLAPEEADSLGLTPEAALCARAGVAFENHPIVDFGVPDMPAFDVLVRQIMAWILSGQNVVVHCQAGIGRSGMVAAGVLIAFGADVQDAIRTVSIARGVKIPDTVEQGEFIARFAGDICDHLRV